MAPDAHEGSVVSKCVYDKQCSGHGRFSRVEPSSVGLQESELEDGVSGLRAAVFSDGQEYVLAFAGTDISQKGDRQADWQQGLGLNNLQYSQAVDVARTLRANLGDTTELTFVGHSLGGGLAAASALATGSAGITYNAAGLHSNTIERYGLDVAGAAQITNHYSTGDILTLAQIHSPAAPLALGNYVAHGDQAYNSIVGAAFSGFPASGNPASVGIGIQRHDINVLIRLLGK